MLYLSDRRRDSQEIFRLQTGAAYERAVYILNGEDISRVRRLDRPAIEKAHSAAALLAQKVYSRLSHDDMYGGDFVIGRGLAAADRPDRLIGERERSARGAVGNGRSNLFGDGFLSLAGKPLLFGLADADDRSQAGPQRRRRLSPDQSVAFAMTFAALGVADDDMAAPDVAQHLRGNVACESAAFGLVAVLTAKRYGAPRQLSADAREMERWRTNQEIDRIGRVARSLGDAARQFGGVA